MNGVDLDFYSEFEGEEEIQIFIQTNLHIKKIRMWIGYFRSILRQIKIPSNSSWTGLVYYNNLLIGWHEEKDWQIPYLEEVLLQLKSIEFPVDNPIDNMGYEPERKILLEMINIVSEGIDGSFPVCITKY